MTLITLMTLVTLVTLMTLLTLVTLMTLMILLLVSFCRSIPPVFLRSFLILTEALYVMMC